MNPLFNPLGNMSQMVERFNQFRQTFQGDPRQQVEDLRRSGKMTDEQFQQLSQMANQFQQMLR